MKKFILLFATILFVACQQPADSIAVVKSDDDKTMAIEKMLRNYLSYDTKFYAFYTSTREQTRVLARSG